MNVKDFIEKALVQIVEGVNNANNAIKNSGALISSKDVTNCQNSILHFQVGSWHDDNGTGITAVVVVRVPVVWLKI